MVRLPTRSHIRGPASILVALLLLALGYLAGTLSPHAQALETSSELLREIRGIHGELTGIRRALEKH